MSSLKELLKNVPVEWKKLGNENIGKFTRGSGLQKKDFTGSGIGCIHYGQVYTFYNTYTYETKSFVSNEFAMNARKAKKGDLVIATTSENDEDVCKAVAWLGEKDIAISSDACFYSHKLNPKYMSYFFQTEQFQKQKRKYITGTKVRRVNVNDLEKILIPVPYPNDPEKSLAIQQEIVRVLDGLSEQNKTLTAALTQEIDNRKKQYEYYREELFRFEGKEVEWKTLGEVAENLDAMRKPVKSGSRDLGNIPYYGASGIVDYVKDYIFNGDFLLVSEDGANLLARSTPIAFSISGKSWVNNHAHILKFENDNQRKLVEYYLNTIDLEPYITGAAQPKLNQKNLNKIKVPVICQELELELIVNLLDKYDEATKNIVAQLEKEIDLRNKQYEYYRNQLLTFNGQ